MKCSSCGAGISGNTVDRIVKCPYCGSEQKNIDYVEKSTIDVIGSKINNILNYNSQQETTRRPDYSGTRIPARPKANGFLTVLLLFLWVFPGIIYLFYIGRQQTIWDEKYSKR
jgi:hypothetical protein